MSEFLAMGGYALYVWPSFGLTFIVMATIVASTRLQRRRSIAAVQRRQQINNASETSSHTMDARQQ